MIEAWIAKHYSPGGEADPEPTIAWLGSKSWWARVLRVRVLQRWYQRARYGYARQDVWNMHVHLAMVIEAMLRDLRAGGWGHPADLTEQEWDQMLATMQDGFFVARLLIEEDVDKDMSERLMRRFRAGMQVFTDRYFDLWD